MRRYTLVCLFLLVVLGPLKSTAQEIGNNAARGKYADANGIKIHYEEYGTGEPLLLIHGNSQSIKAFTAQIPEFSKQYRVIAMDSRGQGRSTEDGKRLTYELMADDVNAFLDKLALSSIKILGWSDGGNVGLILAMRYPEKVKALAIMGANLYNDSTSIRDDVNKQVQSARAKVAKETAPGSKFHLQLIDLVIHEPTIRPGQLSAVHCPTLVMAGSHDIIKEAHTRLIASHIAKSTLVIFENGTHYESQRNPVRFNHEVLGFFNKQKIDR